MLARLKDKTKTVKYFYVQFTSHKCKQLLTIIK